MTGAEVGPKKAATGDDNYVVTLDKSKAGKVTVTDVQGNIATVVSGPVTVGKVSVYVIDQVLMSGECRRLIGASLPLLCRLLCCALLLLPRACSAVLLVLNAALQMSDTSKSCAAWGKSCPTMCLINSNSTKHACGCAITCFPTAAPLLLSN